MFDVSWTELLVVGIVALLVVGPKEMPTLLRTVGKYVGMIRRQAAEFRAQFDEAMREAELDQLRKDVESVKADAEGALRQVEASVGQEMDDARRSLDDAAAGSPAGQGLSGQDSILADPTLPDPAPRDVTAMPAAPTETANGHAAAVVSADPARSAARAEGTVEPKAPL